MKLSREHWSDLRTASVGGVVALILVTAVALWVFTLGQIATDRSTALQAEITKNANLALSHAEHAGRSIEVLDQILLAVRTDYLRHGRPLDLNALLDALQVDRAQISGVVLIDENGQTMASTSENRSNFSDRDYFQHHQSEATDRLLIGRPVMGRLSKQWVISLTRRIDKPDGRFAGVIGMSLSPRFFAKEYEKTTQGSYGSMALIGLDGITRARRNANTVSFGDDARASQLFKELPRSPAGHYLDVAASDGVRRLVAYRRLDDYPMVTIVASSYEDVLATTAGRERLYRGTATVASVAMLLAGLAGIAYLVRRRRWQAALIADKEETEATNQKLARSNADLARSQTDLQAANRQLEAQNVLLEESQVRLAGVIGSAHDAIISIDSQYRIVLFNRAAQTMFGHAETAMLGQTLDALLPRQSRARHSDHVRSFIRQDTSSHRMGGARQLFGLRSDGLEFPIEASISRFQSHGQWQSTVILRDITTRKNTELKLQRSENLFSKAEELAGIGSWDWDLTGGDSIWSDALFAIYGRDKSQGVPGFEAWQETIHPDDHEPLERLINQALADKRNYATEFRIHTKDTGELRFIDSRGEAIVDGDGKVIRIRGVDQDITARKRAESLLRLLEASVAHLNDAVIITAAAPLTAPGPCIVFVNEAAERLTGYTRAELIGQTPRLFQGPGTDQAELRRINAALLQKTSVLAELINYTKAGTEYWVELNITPVLSAAGVTTHFVAVQRDITERRQAEAALIAAKEIVDTANQELARSNADLEQFAYAASHDLQEPLRSVASCVQLLQMRYAGQLDARADTFIAHAVSGATRMQALIDDLLAFSRIGSKSNPTTDISMQSALTAAIANLEMAIADSNAQITHDPLPNINAQGALITQLLQNLIANAIKFRGDKPAVVHVGARENGNEWVFSVADQGIGIEPKYFSRIFELFKRLHAREEYAGTGIGLALCKKIVEQHGGRIWVESAPQQGSIFFFTLPARALPNQATATRNTPP